jgi:DnaJ family protein B protein 11
MPSYEDNNKRGMLIVTFDVEFPRTEMTDEQRATVRQLLQQDSFKEKVYNGLQGY